MSDIKVWHNTGSGHIAPYRGVSCNKYIVQCGGSVRCPGQSLAHARWSDSELNQYLFGSSLVLSYRGALYRAKVNCFRTECWFGTKHSLLVCSADY